MYAYHKHDVWIFLSRIFLKSELTVNYNDRSSLDCEDNYLTTTFHDQYRKIVHVNHSDSYN